jgi:intein/homing endonuclease
MKWGYSIAEDSELYYLKNGILKYASIKELYEDWKEQNKIEVLSLDKKRRDGKIIWKEVRNVFDHGLQETFLVSSHGKEISITKDHSLFTSKYANSFSKIIPIKGSQIKNKTKIWTVENLQIEGKQSKLPSSFLTLCGLWLGDGSYDNKMTNGNFAQVSIATGNDEDVIDFLTKYCEAYNLHFHINHGSFRIHSSKLVSLMQKLGFKGNSSTKQIPRWIFSLSNNNIASFLSGYFSADGSRKISLGSINKDLLKQAQILLNRFGIVSTFSSSKSKLSRNLQYSLLISRNVSKKIFMQKIGFLQEKNVKIGREWCKNHDLSLFDCKIRPNGFKRVFDLEIPETECFVANGFLCHNSGVGKTISDKVSLFFLEQPAGAKPANEQEDEVPYLILGARLTPAGLGKMLKNEKLSAQAFRKANLILYEDLSKATTSYLQKTAVTFLAALTESKTLDDITSDGGGLGLPMSDKKKKTMLSGTPSQFDFLSSQDVFTEYIDRRSISIFLLMSSEEWNERINRARSGTFSKDDDKIIEEWKKIISNAFINSGVQPAEGCPDLHIDLTSKARQEVYNEMLKVKRFPENLMLMIDALAKGHAMLNGRNCTINEDYEVLGKLFSRFLFIGSVRKKEFLLIEEIMRNNGRVSMKYLVHILQGRSQGNNIPEVISVEKTIKKYAESSPFIEYKVITEPYGNLKRDVAYLEITNSLKKILADCIRETKEAIQ